MEVLSNMKDKHKELNKWRRNLKKHYEGVLSQCNKRARYIESVVNYSYSSF